MNSDGNSWKNITYLTGAALGLIAGLTAAHMYTRAAEEHGQAGLPEQIDTGEAFRIGLAAVRHVPPISAARAKHAHHNLWSPLPSDIHAPLGHLNQDTRRIPC